ncbi:MAG: ParB N-terminal domain-containing protein [Candidatus Aenigmatarchaeota archaeon]
MIGSISEKIKYYLERYGHLFHPPRDYNDLHQQFKKIEEINPKDAFPFLHTWKLAEDYENRFILCCRTGGYHKLYYEILTTRCAGKFLRTVGWDTFWEFPKVKAPKDKEEIQIIPKTKEEEREIFIDDIFIPPDYIRRYLDPDRVNRIAGSIKEIGQNEPILVSSREYSKGIEKKYPEIKSHQYILLEGLHRIKAMELLGQKYIRAVIKLSDYREERRKAFAKNVLSGKTSTYEKAIEVKSLIDDGATEQQIADDFKLSLNYVLMLLGIAKANLKSDWKDKEYVLTAFTKHALERLISLRSFWLIDPKSKEGRKYEYVKERAIEDFDKHGIRKIGINEIKKYEKDFDWKLEEEKYGKGVVQVVREALESPIEESQKQIEKPIEEKKTRIPSREEVKEVKRRREEKKKTPEEGLERKVDSYSSSFPKDVAQIWKKYAKSKPIIMKKYLTEYRRNCVARIIKEAGLTNEDLERIFKEEVEKFE